MKFGEFDCVTLDWSSYAGIRMQTHLLLLGPERSVSNFIKIIVQSPFMENVGNNEIERMKSMIGKPIH